MTTETDNETWARTHQACFELTPLVEMRGAQRIQVGFNVDLYARFPMDKERGEARTQAAVEIWTHLRTMLETAAQGGKGDARMEVEQMRPGAVMRQENKLEPEVNLRGRVFHADYFSAVTEEERARLPSFEERLRALGLRVKSW
ncbi:MAG TPA: hypothetical protein PLD86_05975 [Vicinamibacteria bacterium]|nr:hypothetical protein [Vicinamibacteria bacterium]